VTGGVMASMDRRSRTTHPLRDLLQHMDDAPPLPGQQHPQRFLDHVRRNDLRCLPPLYSAYPERTVSVSGSDWGEASDRSI
jgi:hypothetical protein